MSYQKKNRINLIIPFKIQIYNQVEIAMHKEI